jgi:protein-disulfide isomerase
LRARLFVPILAAALAGCSGDVGMIAASGAPRAASTEATPDAAGFDPFGERALTAVGRREVIEHPTLAEIMAPGELPEMALGRRDAPVTIVQYASLSCPYCRKFQIETFPLLKAEYIDTGKVRYVLRAEFPIGKQSGMATIALRCASADKYADKYFVLYDRFMRQQAAWVSQEVRPEAVLGVAAQVGMTRTQFDSCRENRGMIAKLNAIKERGRTLGVVGTPSFFIEGTLVKSVIGIEEIRKMVDPILVGRVALDATTKAR